MKRKTASPEELTALIEGVKARLPAAARDLAREAAGALVEGATGARSPAEILRSPGGIAVVGAGIAVFGAGLALGRASISPRAVTAAVAAGAIAGLIVHSRYRTDGDAGRGAPQMDGRPARAHAPHRAPSLASSER